jgi:hypothetical protein
VSGEPDGESAASCAVDRQLIEDAVKVLCGWEYVEPDDDDEADRGVIEELTDLAREGNLCCATPECLADHWLARQQEAYERSLPIWTCDCEAVYKVLPARGGEEQFFRAEDDGMLGDFIDTIRRDAKGRVKQSGACLDCGRRFADTIAQQTNPQQALF